MITVVDSLGLGCAVKRSKYRQQQKMVSYYTVVVHNDVTFGFRARVQFLPIINRVTYYRYKYRSATFWVISFLSLETSSPNWMGTRFFDFLIFIWVYTILKSPISILIVYDVRFVSPPCCKKQRKNHDNGFWEDYMISTYCFLQVEAISSCSGA